MAPDLKQLSELIVKKSSFVVRKTAKLGVSA